MTNSDILSQCIHWVDHLKRHCVRYDAPDYGRKGRSLIGQYKTREQAEWALLTVLGDELVEEPFVFPVRSSVSTEEQKMHLLEDLKQAIDAPHSEDGIVRNINNELGFKILYDILLQQQAQITALKDEVEDLKKKMPIIGGYPT